MHLRFLATLYDIANERSSTIMFPFPLDSFETGLRQAMTRRSSGEASVAG
jgi:hypothetical protein